MFRFFPINCKRLKTVTTILLIGILLFNWFGYRLLTIYMEGKASSDLTDQIIDNKYDETQLISLKVPITNLSYYQNSKEFEWIDGKIEIGGVQYKYVKRRIYNDSLEVLCIPDQTAIRLKAVRNEYFRFANDLHPGQGKKQGADTYNSRPFSPDYYPISDPFLIGSFPVSLIRQFSNGSFPIYSSYLQVSEHPPELIG
jgi:hypothetical protein